VPVSSVPGIDFQLTLKEALMTRFEKLLSTIVTAHSAVDERRKPAPIKDLRIVVLLLIALAMPGLAFTQLTPRLPWSVCQPQNRHGF
jgi:hypothetical protein